MSINKTVKVVLLLALTGVAQSQNVIEYTTKVKSFPQAGIITMVEDPQVLSCGVPESIEYITCGNNSSILPGGGCEVAASTGFDVNYKVNNVLNCFGSNGTASWQGALPPFAGGSGTFSKTIPSGISQDTLFTLNCEPGSQAHSYKSITSSGMIDVAYITDSVFSLSNSSLMLTYDIQSKEFGVQEYWMDRQVHSPGNKASVMVRHYGSKLYFFYGDQDQSYMIETYGKGFDYEQDVLLSIVSETNINHQEMVYINDDGRCYSLSKASSFEAALKLGNGLAECSLADYGNASLIWYLLQPLPQIEIVSSTLN